MGTCEQVAGRRQLVSRLREVIVAQSCPAKVDGSVTVWSVGCGETNSPGTRR